MQSRISRSVSLLAVLAAVACSETAPPSAPAVESYGTVLAAKPSSSQLSVPINFTDGVLSFAGTYTVTQFAVQNGELVAVGTLTGTVTNALNQVVGTVSRTLTLDVINIQGTCQILHLELGPLDLNLLGLMVHLDKVVLDITAQSGPGNLLGNLLCAIANLLNGSGSLASIAQILNQLIALLG
jgi:hypothetical protein